MNLCNLGEGLRPPKQSWWEGLDLRSPLLQATPASLTLWPWPPLTSGGIHCSVSQACQSPFLVVVEGLQAEEERGIATLAHWAFFQHIRSRISGTFKFTMPCSLLDLHNLECVGLKAGGGRTPGLLGDSELPRDYSGDYRTLWANGLLWLKGVAGPRRQCSSPSVGEPTPGFLTMGRQSAITS